MKECLYACLTRHFGVYAHLTPWCSKRSSSLAIPNCMIGVLVVFISCSWTLYHTIKPGFWYTSSAPVSNIHWKCIALVRSLFIVCLMFAALCTAYFRSKLWGKVCTESRSELMYSATDEDTTATKFSLSFFCTRSLRRILYDLGSTIFFDTGFDEPDPKKLYCPQNSAKEGELFSFFTSFLDFSLADF